jgi:hypothetical protein
MLIYWRVSGDSSDEKCPDVLEILEIIWRSSSFPGDISREERPETAPNVTSLCHSFPGRKMIGSSPEISMTIVI